MTKIIPNALYNEMLVVKKKLFDVLKNVVKEKAIKDLEVEIYNDATGEPLHIHSVYIDPVDGRLCLEICCGKRIFVEDLSSTTKADIVLSMKEITKIIEGIEEQIDSAKEDFDTIQEIAQLHGWEVSVKIAGE